MFGKKWKNGWQVNENFVTDINFQENSSWESNTTWINIYGNSSTRKNDYHTTVVALQNF